MIPKEVKSFSGNRNIHQPGLFRMEAKPPFHGPLPQKAQGPLGLCLAATQNHQVSNAGELPPCVLSEPGVNLSAHRAPIIQPPVSRPSASAEIARDPSLIPSLTNVPHAADGASAS